MPLKDKIYEPEIERIMPEDRLLPEDNRTIGLDGHEPQSLNERQSKRKIREFA